ncbi:hypothetical protein JAAARDRAFT_42903 [Jaapia argillacea MUCL 33604]|uniref:F-box domain-containing protein n=1 Tax=Jaapia argillacea MUCL 33604 TaxID=933084 RepID=A0A067P6Q5_9AGAM|nr:hypothetical protein JAAARDRAFT_42903 [Jaapia argillacea MUCL 33604]
MVKTRRQSGKVSVPNLATSSKQGQKSEDEGDEAWASNLSEPEGEEDEAGSNGRPAKKRRKIAASSTPAPLVKKALRKKGKLSNLPQMPLDILFEVHFCHIVSPLDLILYNPSSQIFGHLGPKDLLNLSRTSVDLSQTLLSRGSVGLWKSARILLDAPECPAGMSEPAWTDLLFGSGCQECGTKGVTQADFSIRRRACNKCRRDCLVSILRFKSGYLEFDRDIPKLLPHTSTITSGQKGSRSDYYWEEDIFSMNQKLQDLAKGINAEETIKAFKAERVAEASAIMENAHQLRRWVERKAEKLKVELKNIGRNRNADIVARFVALGWEQPEVARLQQQLQHEPRNNTELTDRGFASIKKRLEGLLQGWKEERLALEARRRFGNRKALLRSLYDKYLTTSVLKPLEWARSPQYFDILLVEPFKNLLHTDPGVELTEPDCADAIAMLPALLDEWRKRKRADVEALMDVKVDLSSHGAPESNAPQTIRPELAVFECGNRRCRRSSDKGNAIVSFNSAVSHDCHLRDDVDLETHLEFSVRGSAAAASFLPLLGLAPETTPEELDDLDLRLLCDHCPTIAEGRTWGKNAYKWRQCVVHYMESDSDSHPTPSWQPLTPSQVQSVRNQQTDPGKGYNIEWVCGHCPGDHQFWGWDSIVLHCKEKHKLETPKERVDCFYNPRLLRPQPNLVLVPVGDQRQGNGYFYCLHCAGNEIRRKLETVQEHLREKHCVEEPARDFDFVSA